MVKNNLIDNIIEEEVDSTIKDCIRQISQEYLYLSKALRVMNLIIMPGIMNWCTSECVKGYISEEIYDQILIRAITDEMSTITQEDVEKEQERLEFEEKEKAFAEYIDNLIMESCLLRISKEYEIEESAKLKKEEEEKQKRDAIAEKKRKLKEENAKLKLENPPESSEKIKDNNLVPPEGQNIPRKNSAAPSESQNKPILDNNSKLPGSKPASQRSLQDAVKDHMKQQKMEGNQVPKNQLENDLMNLHAH